METNTYRLPGPEREADKLRLLKFKFPPSILLERERNLSDVRVIIWDHSVPTQSYEKCYWI